jgi:PAS domain S-box-containing protein
VEARAPQTTPAVVADPPPGAGEALYRALFGLLPSSVVLLDLDGCVRDANPAFCEQIGYTREQLVGVSLRRFSLEAPEVIEANLARLRAGEVLEHEVLNRRSDGEVRHYELRERAVELPDGSRAILAVANDITPRKLAEAARLELERVRSRSEKLASLESLAGGVAHDFNNLLTTVLGRLELAAVHAPSGSALAVSLEEIAGAAHRAAELARQMLAYSGRGKFVARPIDLGPLVSQAALALDWPPGAGASLELEIEAPLPQIEGDAVQLVQVVNALLANAREALPSGRGVVRVHVRRTPCSADELARSRTETRQVAGGFVCLDIADDGVGMDEAVQQRMFEPFYSTKLEGRGLGLAAVLGIVRGHGGALFVDSAPGRGTRMRVLFPELASTGVRSRAPAAARGTRRYRGPRRGKVLVVDDDAGVRRLVETVLREMGFEPLCAESGEDALELFAQHRDEVLFAFLDLSMPGISGVQTLARLRESRADLCAVLSSGYERELIVGCEPENGFIDFLRKPFEIERLRRVLEFAFEREQG